MAVGTLLADVPMFSRLDEPFTNRVAKCLRRRSSKSGDVIVEPGGNFKDMCLIQEGTVRLEIQTATGEAQVTDLRPGSFFGDVHLLSDVRAHISATAVTDCELLVLTRRRFEKLTGGHPELREAIWASFKAAVLVDVLATVPLLSSLTGDDLVELAARFEWRSFVSGSVLFYQAGLRQRVPRDPSWHGQGDSHPVGRRQGRASFARRRFLWRIGVAWRRHAAGDGAGRNRSGDHCFEQGCVSRFVAQIPRAGGADQR